MKNNSHRQRGLARRGGFTIIELLVAGIVTAFVLGSVSMSLANLGRAKDVAKTRYAAHLRADTALNQVRRDIISIIRAEDLFYTRLLLYSGWAREDDMPRDELLLFNNHTRMIRTLAFTGEGQEYETHFRIEDSEVGPILWQRRDAFPDDYPAGGGIATPLVEGIVGFHVEAYDGLEWWDEWDSDEAGIPLAVRITITATGARDHEDHMNGPFATLRTIIALDRVPTPLGLESLLPDEDDAGDEGDTPAEGEMPDEVGDGGSIIVGPDGQIIRPGDQGQQPTGGGPRPGGGRPRPGGGNPTGSRPPPNPTGSKDGAGGGSPE